MVRSPTAVAAPLTASQISPDPGPDPAPICPTSPPTRAGRSGPGRRVVAAAVAVLPTGRVAPAPPAD